MLECLHFSSFKEYSSPPPHIPKAFAAQELSEFERESAREPASKYFAYNLEPELSLAIREPIPVKAWIQAVSSTMTPYGEMISAANRLGLKLLSNVYQCGPPGLELQKQAAMFFHYSPEAAAKARLVAGTSVRISWRTNEASKGWVEYMSPSSEGRKDSSGGALTVSHEAILTGLSPSSRYEYRVHSEDSSGNQSQSDFLRFSIAFDTVPPAILSPAAAVVGFDSARISWRTDKLAGGQVEYGTSPALGTNTDYQGVELTTHGAVLKGLIADRTYYFKARSFDASGNMGESPVMSFLADFSSLLPAIESASVVGVSSEAVRVVWTVNKPADGEVRYGTTTAMGRRALDPVMATTHGVLLAGLMANATYYFQALSKDAVGNSTRTAMLEYRICVDTIAPVISRAAAMSFSISTMPWITWATNEPADSRVFYGSTTALGMTALDPDLESEHSVELHGLLAFTTYYFKAESTDAAGNSAATGILSFSVFVDTIPPVISQVAASAISSTTARIGWSTDEPSGGLVEYGTAAALGLSVRSLALSCAHGLTLSGLAPGTTHYFRIKSNDASGNLSSSRTFSFKTLSDAGPPVISSAAVRITWTTDKPADSEVRYGTTTALGLRALDPALVCSHSVLLTGLLADATYYFKALSGPTASALLLSGATVYVGGNFSAAGGLQRSNLAAVDAASGKVLGWNPGANGPVNALAWRDGGVYAGGGCTLWGGAGWVGRGGVDGRSGRALDWSPAWQGGGVYALAGSGDALYAGGAGYAHYGEEARNYLAAFGADTGEALGFEAGADDAVYALAVEGAVLHAGGSFRSLGGRARAGYGRLAVATAAAGGLSSFAPQESEAEAALSPEQPPAAALSTGEIFVYPNPAKAGAAPRLRIEAGVADGVAIRIYDVSGRMARQAELNGPPNAGSAYEYAWTGAIPSGVYFYAVEVRRQGQAPLRKTGKFAVVR
jgi:phosphodiesterase/alkaline phosphatase D-like protein